MAALCGCVVLIALLAALAAGANIVFPGQSSRPPHPTPAPTAVPTRLGSERCPFPLAEGATLASLPAGCYTVTDEEDGIVLLTGTETPCQRNFVRVADGRCLKVVRRILTSQPPKKNKSPQGTPSW